MNVVLKNNRNLLSKRKREKFKQSVGGFSNPVKLEFNYPKASLSDLRLIKTKLIEEQRIKQRKVIMIFALISIIILTGLIYLNYNSKTLFSFINWS